MNEIYLDVKKAGSFGGIDALKRETGKKSKEVKEYLLSQDAYTLHAPTRQRFQRRKFIVRAIDEQHQADLVDLSHLMKYNNNFRYVLTCIDVLSRFAWAIPLKSKRGPDIVSAFQKIFDEGRIPIYLLTDKGTEFLNHHVQTFLKKHGVHHITTNNEPKAAIVERFNRTLKSRMFRYFTYKMNTRKYIDVLPDLLESYNNTYHRSIGRSPISVTTETQVEVWNKLYGDNIQSDHPHHYLKPGDLVRLSFQKETFRKGYLQSWTDEIFKIKECLPGNPPLYRIEDYNNEPISGTFYREELLKVNKKDNIFKIEKILARRGKGTQREVLVRWENYSPKFDSWIREAGMFPV